MASDGFDKRQDSDEVRQVIRSAIKGRQPIVATYKGHQHQRFLCPHRLGKNGKGELRLLSYQYAGHSESGLQPPGSKDNWRCLALAQLNTVELLNGPWHTAENHIRPASCIAEVELDVSGYDIHRRD